MSSSQELLSSQHVKSELSSSDAPLPSSPSPEKKQEPSLQQNVSSTYNGNNDDKANIPMKDSPSQHPSSGHNTTTNQNPSSTAGPNNNPRLTALQSKHATLTSKLATLQAQRDIYIAKNSTLPSGLPMPAEWTHEQKQKQALATANAVIKEHIALLHGYNEIKDIGQGLMGIVAEKRGVRIAAVMEDFGMGEKD